MTTVKIFLGGGVKLLHGEADSLKGYRNDVIDPVISQLNSVEYAKYVFIAKDFSDLTRNVVKGKQQEVYNRFIERDSQIALFIIDGKIGNITKHEIDIAVNSTKKTKHPVVYIYGKNINDDDEILDYLNQEGIYFQHFFDNRDLAIKIKADLEAAVNLMGRRKALRIWSYMIIFLILGVGLLLLKNIYIGSDDKTIKDCSFQMYLMRYKDINIKAGTNVFNDGLLDGFKYEDSVLINNDISVYPIVGNDSVIITTPPFFRLKLYNHHRNTIVFVEAWLEIDKYVVDNNNREKNYESKNLNIPDVNIVNIESDKTEYRLMGFRQSLSYGETDDRYWFGISSEYNSSFRMRVKAKSQLGEYIYSNYIYVNYVK